MDTLLAEISMQVMTRALVEPIVLGLDCQIRAKIGDLTIPSKQLWIYRTCLLGKTRHPWHLLLHTIVH
jgi:hypothetical protein